MGDWVRVNGFPKRLNSFEFKCELESGRIRTARPYNTQTRDPI